MAFSDTFPTIYNYNQPPFWGGWCGNSAGGYPIIERSKKFAEKGAIKPVNVLVAGD